MRIFSINLGSGGSGAAAVWGGITGTLSNQTDLQNALNAKANILTRSEVWVYNGAGLGSASNNKIYTYTTALVNTGSSITYTSDAVNGDKWTINTNGVYVISAVLQTTSASRFGITLNQSNLTTFIASLTAAEILTMNTGIPNGTSETAFSTVAYFLVNDVIRVNTGSSAFVNSSTCQFHIVRAA